MKQFSNDPVAEALQEISTNEVLQGSESLELRKILVSKAYDERLQQSSLPLQKAKHDLEKRKFWHNTPLVVALTGLIAIGSNFLVDFHREEQDFSNLLTKTEFDETIAMNAAADQQSRDVEMEQLRSEIREAAANSDAGRATDARKLEFQYTILEKVLDVEDEAGRAKMLLFYIKAGALDGLETGTLEQIAENSIRETGGSISEPFRVPSSGPSSKDIVSAINATTRVQFSGSTGQTGYCTAVYLTGTKLLVPSLCDNNIFGGNHPFAAALADGDEFIRLKEIWNHDGTALSVLEFERSGSTENAQLNWKAIRKPVLGEAIYFASWDSAATTKFTRVCFLTEVSATDLSFQHDCPTEAGSAGALLIGVSDDAPIGVHIGQNEKGGYGASLALISDEISQLIGQ